MMERWQDIRFYPGPHPRVCRGRIVVRLQPVKGRILRHLLAACGSAVSTERLMDTVYGNLDPPLDGVLATHICEMRKAIAPLGFQIVRRVGVGWHIVDVAEPQSARCRLETTVRRVRDISGLASDSLTWGLQ